MHRSWSQRFILVAPFLLVIASLFAIFWSAQQILASPYTGADWSQSTGVVVSVDADGPASGLIQVGDRILAIDNTSWNGASLQPPKAVGDIIHFQILRAGVEHQVAVRLHPPPLSVILLRQLPLLVALTFWIVSVIILAFKPSGIQSSLFLLFCQVFVGTLAFGATTLASPHWRVLLFQVLLWWVGPITVHFHIHFPLPLTSRYTRLLTMAAYLIAALGSFLTVFSGTLSGGPIPGLFASSLIWLTACLLGVVFCLWRAYRRATTLEIQRQLRLVGLGGGVTFASFLILLLIPYALIHQPILPYDIVFVLLMIIPLTYGYAILSYRLIRLDPYVSRIAAYMLVLTILISTYLALNFTLVKVIPSDDQQRTANLVTIVALTSTTIPLYRQLQASVNALFYGGSYDYRSAVQLVSRTLDQPTSPQVLPQTLCEGIQKAMQLECVRLLLPDASGVFVVAGLADEITSDPLADFRLEPTSRIYEYLRDHPHPIYAPELLDRLSSRALSADETRMLCYEQARLWVPLSSTNGLLGLFVLGHKRGSEIFDVTDLEILHVIMRLSSTSMQNIQFIDELRQQAVEREKLHQQVLNAREEERKHVARELHDQIIQPLAGMNYHLTNLRDQCSADLHEQIAQLQSGIHHTLDDVRRICADLRPPALDNLGLVSAVRSRLRTLDRQTSLEVSLHVTGDIQQQLPEDVSITMFRVMQEALSNIQKHAEAHSVDVQLDIRPDKICLIVRDDGKGFQVPIRLGQFIEGHHFGLVGLRERLDMIHGTLQVASAPDEGTCIRACAPLSSPPLRPLREGMMYD